MTPQCLVRSLVRTRIAAGAVLLPAGLAVASLVHATPALAAAPSVTCDGHHTATMSPGETNTATRQTGTVTFEEGLNDLIPGLLTGSDCQSTDPSISGATMTMHISVVESCTETKAGSASFTGTIAWNNGRSSTLSNGTFTVDTREDGDASIAQTATITAGEFAGHSVTILADADTGNPRGCNGSGVQHLAGSDSITVW